ncbi:hypothetical protein A9Q90_05075 [Gammaproteobacteria bacterium 54_18_T64]|nr:hypothetical protein A9Q90_05075 [Gammaproteobacteria bacterium 54_18_T64]
MNKVLPLSLIPIALHAPAVYAQKGSRVDKTLPSAMQTTSEMEAIIVASKTLDDAGTLQVYPSATSTSRDPITGIAQYCGLFGDRVAVSMEN